LVHSQQNSAKNGGVTVGVYFEENNINTRDADGELVLKVLGMFAELEREEIEWETCMSSEQESNVAMEATLRISSMYRKTMGTPLSRRHLIQFPPVKFTF